jgi:hypothetical protein
MTSVTTMHIKKKSNAQMVLASSSSCSATLLRVVPVATHCCIDNLQTSDRVALLPHPVLFTRCQSKDTIPYKRSSKRACVASQQPPLQCQLVASFAGCCSLLNDDQRTNDRVALLPYPATLRVQQNDM